MEPLKQRAFAALDALGIAYETYEHPAVFTSEDAEQHWGGIPGTPVKNLFLRNKKGDRHYLVILGIDKRADLRLFHPNDNTATVTISFADLQKFLRTRGNVVRYIRAG